MLNQNWKSKAIKVFINYPYHLSKAIKYKFHACISVVMIGAWKKFADLIISCNIIAPILSVSTYKNL